MKTKYSLYLRNEQLEQLKKKSAATHIAVSELIRMAIDASLSDALVQAAVR
jgi:hypothetical protein